MADEKKHSDKSIVVEFKIYMHCEACERKVAKIISKFKGVEKFSTDMNDHKVAVTGQINPEKIMKKLKRKTGKTVEILARSDDLNDSSNGGDSNSQDCSEPAPLMFDDCEECGMLTMFNDENPNACLIM